MKISLALEGHFARIKPVGYLGGELFTTYRKASEGAIYDAGKKANFATLDKVPGIIKRLREADFPIQLDASLEEALSKQEAQVWLDVQAAKDQGHGQAWPLSVSEDGRGVVGAEGRGALGGRDGPR